MRAFTFPPQELQEIERDRIHHPGPRPWPGIGDARVLAAPVFLVQVSLSMVFPLLIEGANT